MECGWPKLDEENRIVENIKWWKTRLFCIVEANILSENNIKHYEIKDYTINMLPKSRQVASGILVETHKKLPLNIVKNI